MMEIRSSWTLVEGWRMHSAFCILPHRYVAFIVPAMGVCHMSAASRHAAVRVAVRRELTDLWGDALTRPTSNLSHERVGRQRRR